MIRIFSLLIFVLLLFVLISLAYLNADQVIFDYLFSKTEISLSLLLLFSFLLGVVLSTLVYISLIFFQKRKISQLSSIKVR